jgi:hypothetical protein
MFYEDSFDPKPTTRGTGSRSEAEPCLAVSSKESRELMDAPPLHKPYQEQATQQIWRPAYRTTTSHPTQAYRTSTPRPTLTLEHRGNWCCRQPLTRRRIRGCSVEQFFHGTDGLLCRLTPSVVPPHNNIALFVAPRMFGSKVQKRVASSHSIERGVRERGVSCLACQ